MKQHVFRSRQPARAARRPAIYAGGCNGVVEGPIRLRSREITASHRLSFTVVDARSEAIAGHIHIVFPLYDSLYDMKLAANAVWRHSGSCARICNEECGSFWLDGKITWFGRRTCVDHLRSTRGATSKSIAPPNRLFSPDGGKLSHVAVFIACNTASQISLPKPGSRTPIDRRSTSDGVVPLVVASLPSIFVCWKMAENRTSPLWL